MLHLLCWGGLARLNRCTLGIPAGGKSYIVQAVGPTCILGGALEQLLLFSTLENTGSRWY